MLPLQVPGGIELLIIGIILLIFIAVFVGILGVIAYLTRSGTDTSTPEQERIAELERRVEALEEDDPDRRDGSGD